MNSVKKNILITGGSEGLGRKMAERLSKNHRVLILASNEEKLRETASELSCEYAVCDVSDASDVSSAAKKALETLGGIDCIVNNAGIWIEGELEKNEAGKIKKVLEVNTLGTILFSREVIPHMKSRQKGMIINVVSQAGLTTKPLRTVYNASKWAVTGFTRSLQAELAPHGIRVTGIYPGQIKTNLFRNAGFDKDTKNALDADEVAKIAEFVVDSEETTLLTEIGLKHLSQQ